MQDGPNEFIGYSVVTQRQQGISVLCTPRTVAAAIQMKITGAGTLRRRLLQMLLVRLIRRMKRMPHGL
jgi:hypothetical protein